LREFFNNVMTEAIWISDELFPEGTISSDMGEQPEVVIKVSSLAVHNTLVMPSDNTLAFLCLQGLECKALSDVLIGVWSPTKASMVTCMKDLRKDGYQSLKPCNISDVSVLWNSFATLVHELLLPLARRRVVYCDIRPGWDCTANLMRNNAGGRMQLRLVDLESLSLINYCSDLPIDKRCFHILFSSQSDEKRNAFAFLWWQCLLVANTWLNKSCSENLDAEQFVIDCCSGKLSACFQGFLDNTDITFLQEFAKQKKVTETTVTISLQIFGKVFNRIAKQKCSAAD